MERIICLILGYFIGCIQSAYLVGKLFHTDIRKHGSGNLGSTNALRVLGVKAGAMTFFGDVMKSVAAFLIASALFKSKVFGVYACAGVILGHDFPVFLGFKGGKGIAATIGMILCLGPAAIVRTFPFGILGLLTKYVSVGSILFSVSIPIGLKLAGFETEIVIVCLLISILNIISHRQNIKRLLSGTENKLGSKKK